MEKMMEYYTLFHQKRVKSFLKSRPKLNLVTNNNKAINNNKSKKNTFHLSLNDQPKNYESLRLQTEYSTIPSYKYNFPLKKKVLRTRASSVNPKKSKLNATPENKKILRGKLKYLVKNNIILCEKKFNPRSFTESISHVHVKEFKNRFKNINNRNKVGIFTNKFPSILNTGNKFYARYFDCFISPDELLSKNFNKNEIFQIKTDPNYFNFGNNFNNVSFFRKKTLKETLNEEEKIGPTKLMDISLKRSLKQTKKRIKGYLNYYTSIMSKQGFIGAS